MRYDSIQRADGLVLSAGKPAAFEGENNLATLRPSPTRRINVVLREAAHQRLNRLLSQLEGLTLVDLVMTAVGVVDASLRSDDTEAEHSSNSKSDDASDDNERRCAKQEKEVA